MIFFDVKKSDLIKIIKLASNQYYNNFVNNDLFDQFDDNYSVQIYIIHYIKIM